LPFRATEGEKGIGLVHSQELAPRMVLFMDKSGRHACGCWNKRYCIVSVTAKI